MGIWTPAEPPGLRDRRSWLFDAWVTVSALLANTVYASAAPGLPIWVALAIIAAMTIPLVVRRLWPLPVFAFALLVASASGWWAMQVVWSPALAIALYTVAVLRQRREAVIAAVLLAAGAVASSVHVFPRYWSASAALLVAIVVAVTVLGLYIRTRRALLEQLRERSRQLERSRDQEVALAASAERTRIARDMHDIVAHHLTVMVTLSDGAAAQAAADSDRADRADRAAEAMRTVSATGRQALADTRLLLGVLRDDTVTAARTPMPDFNAVAGLVESIRLIGTPVRYDVEGTPAAASTVVQLAVYRIVQESLTNIMRHAGPNATATVRLSYGTSEVCVEVADDGVGAARGAPSPGTGRGLIGMRERVDALGGQLHSGPGRPLGWLVTARLPMSGERRS